MGECDDATFSLSAIFRRMCKNPEAASWLLSRDLDPPTIITPLMMETSITADVCAMTQDQSMHERRPETLPLGSGKSERAHGTTVFKKVRPDVTKSQTSSSTSELPFNIQSVERKAMEPETVAYVVHAIYGNYAFMSLADTRIPFAFLEAASDVQPGVRRGFVESTKDDTFVCVCFWKRNGRSSMIIERYPHDLTQPGRKCFMLIRPYPPSRYPCEKDVMEVGWITDPLQCQFCLLRGYSSCECSSLVVKRTIPNLPPLEQRTPWSMFSWFYENYDSGFKKHTVSLFNFEKKFDAKALVVFHVRPTFNKNDSQEHRRGFQHYIDIIRPFYHRQMLKWRFGTALVPLQPGSRDVEDVKSPSAFHPDYNVERVGQDNKAHVVDEKEVGKTQMICASSENTFAMLIDQVLDGGMASRESRAISDSRLPVITCRPLECDPAPIFFHDVNVVREAIDVDPRYVGITIEDNVLKQRTCVVDEPVSLKRKSSSNDHSDDQELCNVIVKKTKRSNSSEPDDIEREKEKQIALAYLDEIDTLNLHHDTRCECKLCGSSFTRKYDLKRHIKTSHLDQRDYACEACGRKFKRQQHLNVHEKLIHAKSEHGNSETLV
mmetsp:Transcript_13951/g.23812  ORF Transcript_13951/g.23812 Transcript_13951/m.23812 type:complete len:605 (+) Transcript_13951:387-2201(+)